MRRGWVCIRNSCRLAHYPRLHRRRRPCTHPLTLAALLLLLPLLLLQIEGAHPIGCTAVSWSPAAPKGSLVSSQAPGQPVRRIVSSGCDNCVKVRQQVAAAALQRGWRQRGMGCGLCLPALGPATAESMCSRAMFQVYELLGAIAAAGTAAGRASAEQQAGRQQQ